METLYFHTNQCEFPMYACRDLISSDVIAGELLLKYREVTLINTRTGEILDHRNDKTGFTYVSPGGNLPLSIEW